MVHSYWRDFDDAHVIVSSGGLLTMVGAAAAVEPTPGAYLSIGAMFLG